MSDSFSQPSPHTPSWDKVREVLGNPLVSCEVQSREIWRAASNDPDAALLDNLSNPLIISACRLASEDGDLALALSSYQALVNSSHVAGLFIEIAKRALARAVLSKGGSLEFSQELFAEIVSYYASRDLSGLVGSTDKLLTAFDSIRLKEDLRDLARKAVLISGPPPTNSRDWPEHIRVILLSLQSNELS